MVDPSLFTAPYDAALTEGLLASGTNPVWAGGPTRRGDRQEIPADRVLPMFYRRVDQLQSAPAALRTVLKGAAHLWGLLRLVARVYTQRPDVVHFQWLVVPPLDLLAMRLIGRRAPVVLTVHDTVPFNGDRLSQMQTGALDLALRTCDALIVHTAEARRAADRARAARRSDRRHPARPTGAARSAARGRRPRQPTAAPLHAVRRAETVQGDRRAAGRRRLAAAGGAPPARGSWWPGARAWIWRPSSGRSPRLGLDDVVELRAHRLSEPEMAELFAATDCFLFPYRQIDASGVYYLTKALGKWMIASRVGIFAEDLADGSRGALVAPEAPDQLASAIANAIDVLPRPAPYAPEAGVAEHRGGDGARCTRPPWRGASEPIGSRAHRPAGPPRWRRNEHHALAVRRRRRARSAGTRSCCCG